MSEHLDLYAITFDDLDTHPAPQPLIVKSPREEPPQQLTSHANELYTFNFLPVETEIVLAQPKLDTPSNNHELSTSTPYKNNVARRALKEIVVSPEMTRLADQVVQQSIDMLDQHVISLTTFNRLAFEAKDDVAMGERWDLKNALKQHPSLNYLGDNQFGIRDRLTADNYWPGAVSDERLDLTTIVDSTVALIESSKIRHTTTAGLLGAVASQGIWLTPQDTDKILAQLVTHPQLRPLEDGRFSIRSKEITKHEEKPRKHRESILRRHELQAIDKAFHHQRHHALNTITKRAKKRPYQLLTRAPRILHPSKVHELSASRIERLFSRAKAKNQSNFPLHGGLSSGKKRHQQGRSHGKKLSFEEHLAQAAQQRKSVQP